MDIEDAMPCGDCCVCGEPVDHSDAGFCGDCQGAFHWGRCGEWGLDEHQCKNCKPEDDYEQE